MTSGAWRSVFFSATSQSSVSYQLRAGNNAVAVRVNVFNWIFNRDDMTIAICVSMSDHGGQGGGFTGTSCTDHDN